MTILELSQVSKTYNPGAPGEVKGLFIIEGVGVVCGVRRVVAG